MEIVWIWGDFFVGFDVEGDEICTYKPSFDLHTASNSTRIFINL